MKSLLLPSLGPLTGDIFFTQLFKEEACLSCVHNIVYYLRTITYVPRNEGLVM